MMLMSLSQQIMYFKHTNVWRILSGNFPALKCILFQLSFFFPIHTDKSVQVQHLKKAFGMKSELRERKHMRKKKTPSPIFSPTKTIKHHTYGNTHFTQSQIPIHFTVLTAVLLML